MLTSSLIQLGRFDRPIGAVLLLFPCWWGVALVRGLTLDFYLLGLFAVGAAVMRGAGCCINDYLDQEFDRRVHRTKSRPLASGKCQSKEAFGFAAFLLFIGFLVLLQLPQRTWLLSFFAAFLAGVYPLSKRFTRFPQFFFGITYNLGLPIGALAAVYPGENFPLISVLFAYLGAVCWSIAYDTIYALQDVKDDRHIGIGSTALHFGSKVREIVFSLYILMHGLLLLSILPSSFHIPWLSLSCIAGSLVYILIKLARLDAQNEEECRQFFLANQWVGMLVFMGFIFN